MRRLMLFAVGFSVAAMIFLYILFDARILWVAGGCLVLSPLLRWLGLKRSSVVLLGLTAGVLWCFAYGEIRFGLAERAQNSEQVISAEIVEMPEKTEYGVRATVDVLLEGREYRAVLYGQDDLLEATAGDRIECVARIESVVNFGNGEQRYYYRSAGVMLLLYAEDEISIVRGQPGWCTGLRLWLQSRIEKLYKETSVPFLKALITGYQGDMSYGLRNAFSVAGLSHTVAVSGLHVSVLLSALALFCGHNPRLTALLGIPMSIAFVVMTGASPSACRAALMQTLLLLAPLVRREHDPWTSLSAAALLLLLENPWVITNVSFQLSFAAVAGLILFSSPIQKRLLDLRKKPGRMWRLFASGVSATVSATLTTLPLVIGYFGLVSLCAVITNLLTMWAIEAVLILGLLSCLLGSFGAILAVVVELLAGYIMGVANVVTAFPFAAAYIQNIPLMIWAVCAYGFLAFFLLCRKCRILLPLICLTVGFLCCVLWGNWNYTHDTPVYRALDVGQGQCIMMETEAVSAMIDCGGPLPDAAGEQAARTLLSVGKKRLDILVVTHFDMDHAGGVPQVLQRLNVGVVLIPDVSDKSGMRQAIEEAAEKTDTQVIAVSELMEMTFSNGKITVYPPLSDENDNNAGICVLATAAEYDMLITGDLDILAELRLMSHYELPEVEILVAGHHGARTSTGETLLKKVKPELVVISAGENNAYGHPAEETMKRIAESGAEVICTSDAGTILLRGR